MEDYAPFVAVAFGMILMRFITFLRNPGIQELHRLPKGELLVLGWVDLDDDRHNKCASVVWVDANRWPKKGEFPFNIKISIVEANRSVAGKSILKAGDWD